MERRVKERLIGAGILVALAVVVVPELLSGPQPEETQPEVALELPQAAAVAGPVRNVTVDLNTSKPLQSAAQATALSPEQPTPSPSVTAAPAPMTPPGILQGDPNVAGVAPEDASAPASTVNAPRTASAEAVAASPRLGASLAVQLGSFANRSNADTLVHQLKAQGFAVYTSNEGSGRAVRYRVRVGPFNDRDAAERTIAKLKLAGHSATLVAPR